MWKQRHSWYHLQTNHFKTVFVLAVQSLHQRISTSTYIFEPCQMIVLRHEDFMWHCKQMISFCTTYLFFFSLSGLVLLHYKRKEDFRVRTFFQTFHRNRKKPNEKNFQLTNKNSILAPAKCEKCLSSASPERPGKKSYVNVSHDIMIKCLWSLVKLLWLSEIPDLGKSAY